MEAKNDSQMAMPFSCSFCDSQQFEKGSCLNCGASSLNIPSALSDRNKKKSILSRGFYYLVCAALCFLFVKNLSIISDSISLQNQKLEQAQNLVIAEPPRTTTTNSSTSVMQPLHGSSIGVPLKPNPDQIKLVSAKPTPYPMAKSTWGDKFNPDKEVPTEGFYAFYFDRTKTDKRVYRDHVEKIGLFHSYSELKGIPSNNLAAYWVGAIKLDKAEKINVVVEKGWLSARVIIDGAIVYESSRSPAGSVRISLPHSGPKSSDGSPIISLSKGVHVVEVEFINHWHTTKFNASFNRFRKKHSDSEIKQALEQNTEGNYEFQYVGVYESNDVNNNVFVSVKKRKKPIVLVLNSRKPVNWHIENSDKTDINAVVYGSYGAGSTINGYLKDTTQVLHKRGYFGNTWTERKCSCYAGIIQCEGNNVTQLQELLSKIGNGELKGVTNERSASQLRTAQIAIDGAYNYNENKRQKKLDDYSSACYAGAKPDFDNFFNDSISVNLLD